MKSYKVLFAETGQYFESSGDETLLELMRRAGMHPDAPCGGQGKCGKCAVTLDGAETVLACRQKINRDLVVTACTPGEEQARILTETSTGSRSGLRPVIRSFEVSVPPCPKGESSSEWTRFSEAAGKVLAQMSDPGRDEAVSFFVSPEIASRIGTLCARGNGRIFAAVSLGEEKIRVLEISDRPFPVFLAAFDIGTTTVAAYLLDAETGRCAATASCMNPQAQYGADVINRANYTLEHGMQETAGCIRRAVNELLLEMAEQAGVRTSDIYALSIAGNTCMHHLFLEISVDTLVHAPYNPALSDPVILSAADYGIEAHPSAVLYMLPNIAGFVGADTVGCLVSTKLAEQEDWTLLIDIGTNGEMVLGRSHELIACSTAAGPAFEGAGISCGMRGAGGAISRVSFENGKPAYEVIGGGKVKGICGSGLLDLAAVLLQQGLMDESGELFCGKVLLADRENSFDGREMYLNQKDVRQLQLAKAAIASGVYLLAEKKNIPVESISKVWLAGAFGSFLSPESACAIGLIPPQLNGKIRAVGNAAGEGAKQVLLDIKQWEYAAALAAETDFLELATMPQFQDRFVDELEFPEQ